MADERSITVREVQVNGDRIVLPCGSKIVASYNWSTTSTSGNPHIIAAGTPSAFVSPSSGSVNSCITNPRKSRKKKASKNVGGFTLDKQYGKPVVDENGTRMYPLNEHEPTFLSLDVCSPGFNLETVDIATDRNNLRKLLRFWDSPGSSTTTHIKRTDHSNEAFKFFVHGIDDDRKRGGPTLVFTRATTGREENIRGYGESFEKKLTAMDPSASPDTGRFSVVTTMSLDGVTLLVRSKVDAGETAVEINFSATDETCNMNDIQSEHRDDSESSGLSYTRGGELLGDEPQLLELKSRSKKYTRDINWKDIHLQMTLRCANRLVLGLHTRGKYDPVEQLHISEVKARAEEAGSSSMVYLANTLREVIKAAHCLMAAPATLSSRKGREAPRAAVVVERFPSTPRIEGLLTVRLAVPGD